LPLPWFRRRDRRPETQPTDQTSDGTPSAAGKSEPLATSSEEAAETTQPARRRRRRGTRGGRARKRSAAAADAAEGTAAAAEAASATDGAVVANGAGPANVAGPAKSAAAAKGASRRAASRSADGKPARSRRSDSRRRQQTRRSPLPAAKRELLVSVSVTEQRVAVLEDDRVAEVYLERPGRRSIAGNVYKGVVDNVLPGMEAAFVEIGLEKNGFLYVDEIVTPELEGRRHGRRIQDLLSRGQEILVQAVKDPMKTKGARLTTEISLPGRFVVYVPQGEGVGVSRRLDDDERSRLRDILRQLDLPGGGIIVRTAAEGASAEDVERDIRFLEKLWREIQARAKAVDAPSLVYSEAELPLRVVRDLFTGDFERALVDDDVTFKRITGYLKKTSPHMAERVHRYREKEPLFEAYGVDAEIRSTLNRRVELPSGGYLVFDYAEAFTVIDVNTGRFVGSRSKSSAARLEDTITKNNLEAVKEVVRQLRLRDIGGIIVIDFIDMANPKNRQQVEEELKAELERDRTKTYVVEISPLGLVEMTRQNVTDGPREILTKRCPTCAGDGIVVSETSAAVEAERRLRALAAHNPRTKAFKVELNPQVAATLIGPGAQRLAAIEQAAKRTFLLEPREGVALDHFVVLDKGTPEKLMSETPFAPGRELDVKLVEVGRYDPDAGVGKLDGHDICVGEAARLVGKKVKARVERVVDGTVYATLVGAAAAPAPPPPITAEGLAEKPTRVARRTSVQPAQAPEATVEGSVAAEGAGEEPEQQTAPPTRTRRGTRGGRRRRKGPVAAGADGLGGQEEEPAGPRIHLPEPDLGLGQPEHAAENGAETQPGRRARARRRDGLPASAELVGDGAGPAELPAAELPATGAPLAEEHAVAVDGVGVADDGAEASGAQPAKRKRTRRGTRGGRRRRKAAAAVPGQAPSDG